MNISLRMLSVIPVPTTRPSTGVIIGQVLLGLGLLFLCGSSVWAQESQDSKPPVTQQELETLIASKEATTNTAATKPGLGGLNFLKLLVDGGALMIPIGVMSLLVVAIGVERSFALRSSRIFPRRLRRELRRASDDEITMSPAELFRTAELFPSPAGRILKELLTKVGRPIPEVEALINEATQREADRLYGNVRWLNLATAVTPLIGLLGTVGGMILAFYNTTQVTSGSNRVESLAE